MLMINFTNPLILLTAVLIFIIFLALAKYTKRSIVMIVVLFAFSALLIAHTVTYITGSGLEESVLSDLIYTMIFDVIFMFISFIGYLWIDDIEARKKQKKSIDNSLDWFWEKL